MMDIWQIDKLLLFLIFFIPGFISIKVYNLLMPSERRDFTKSLFEVVGYSSLNFALLSWLILLIHSGKFYNEHTVLYFIFIFLILFLFPALWPILLIRLSTWKSIAKYVISPIKSPWDYVFGKRESYWVIVHLKNGRKIGGKFATKSSASSYPAEREIYLEQLWRLDANGNFLEPVKRSKGIIISNEEISAVEFFK